MIVVNEPEVLLRQVSSGSVSLMSLHSSLLARAAVSLKAQLGKNPLLTNSVGSPQGCLMTGQLASESRVSDKAESVEDEAAIFSLSTLKYDFVSLLPHSLC